MKNKRERKYYIAIITFVLLYWISTQFIFETPDISKRISTTVTLIGAVTFWMQLRRSEHLNEASYMMNLNNQFINNKEMTAVEHELELYFNKSLFAKDISEVELGLDLNRESQDCQKLINYLVHMEGLAAIVQTGVLHLDVIDDLFAYRFFIAVNNPVIQRNELLPYANFYQGCFRLSKLWTEKWREEKREIPLDEYALFECDECLKNKIGRDRCDIK